MKRLILQIDRLLRGEYTREEDLQEGVVRLSTRALVVSGLVLGAVYGFFMGLYSLLRPGEAGGPQILLTMVKVPLLFLLTLVVTFPSLYAFSALAGSHLGGRLSLNLLLVAVTVNLALLASLGPVTGFFTLSTDSYDFMVILNVGMFTVSGLVGIVFLQGALLKVFGRKEPDGPSDGSAGSGDAPASGDAPKPEARPWQRATYVAALDPARRTARRIFTAWIIVYGIVGAQMGWILRPFIGAPNKEFVVFRERESSFFEAVIETLGRLLGASAMLAEVDLLLHGRGRYAASSTQVPWPALLGILATCGFLYGAAMGSHGMRLEQALYSGIKVPLLLAASTLICLPSFYVLNVILGLATDFAAACRGILAAQATLAVALVSLAPVTLFLYASSYDYRFAVATNGAMFLAATVAGQICLDRHYRPLVAGNPRHKVTRAAWMVLYVFVAIQLAWVLRPYIGAPSLETTFLREDAWSNAYVVLLRDLARIGPGW